MLAICSLSIESASGPVPMPYTSQPSSIWRVVPPGGVALQLRLPPIRSMADNPDALKTSPEQYLERAKIIRWQTETMSNADVCRQLLDIAERYEELADG